MPTLTLRLPDELHEKLRWQAFKDHRSQHSIVIELLEKALKQVKVPKEGQEVNAGSGLLEDLTGALATKAGTAAVQVCALAWARVSTDMQEVNFPPFDGHLNLGDTSPRRCRREPEAEVS